MSSGKQIFIIGTLEVADFVGLERHPSGAATG
jgi:hypothetical protein